MCGEKITTHALILLGVALLPFVDERRLRAALEEVYPDLTPEESKNYNLIYLERPQYNRHLILEVMAGSSLFSIYGAGD